MRFIYRIKKILLFIVRYRIIHEEKRSKLLHANGWDVLKNIASLLEDNKIFYWIDGGTLLGMVRDNNFIVADTDIDIGIFIEQPNHLYELLQNEGYSMWYYYADSHDTKYLIKAEKNFIRIDFEIFTKADNKYYYDSPRKLSKQVERQTKNQYSIMRFEFDADIIENQTTFMCRDLKINIPKNYDTYLATYYKNWKIKEKKSTYSYRMLSVPIDKYTHHNNRAYPKKGNNYLYGYPVSPSTIRITLFELCFFYIKKLNFFTKTNQSKDWEKK